MVCLVYASVDTMDGRGYVPLGPSAMADGRWRQSRRTRPEREGRTPSHRNPRKREIRVCHRHPGWDGTIAEQTKASHPAHHSHRWGAGWEPWSISGMMLCPERTTRPHVEKISHKNPNLFHIISPLAFHLPCSRLVPPTLASGKLPTGG